jgi:sugar lactone lactonase YvrE
MGTQSSTPPSSLTCAPLRIALLLLLSLLPIVCIAQTTSPVVSATTVPLLLPSAIVFDPVGNLYIAETANHVIRKVDTNGNITTIAGTGMQGFSSVSGPASAAHLDSPKGLALDTANNLYIADTHNHVIRKLSLTTNILTKIAGNGAPGFSGDSGPATSAQLDLPIAIAVDAQNNLYLADARNHRIRRIDAATGVITTIAGNGTQGFSGDNTPATAASIDSPTGLALDASNNLYLADTHNHRIRRIDAITGVITTIAGNGSLGYSGDTAPAATATLALPHGLTLDAAGDIYFADTENHRIRRIDAITGIITTVAGNGAQGFSGDNGPATAAALDTPRDTAFSPTALLTLADTGNQRIRQLEASSSYLQTTAGLGLTTPGVLTLTAPSVISYGTGNITATLATSTPATGLITFLDTTTPPPSPSPPSLSPQPPQPSTPRPCLPDSTTSPPFTREIKPTPPRKAPSSPSPSTPANSVRPSPPALCSTASLSRASPARSPARSHKTSQTSPRPSPPPPPRSPQPAPISSLPPSAAPQQGTMRSPSRLPA